MVKAALYEGVKRSGCRPPHAKAGPGEAVVKIALCGICGTDLHIYFEGMLPPPFVPGHENVGTVVELGEGVEGLAVGDRVVAGPPGSCGGCYFCLHGRPNLCIYGFEQTNGLRRDGGMAEYMLVKDARQMLYPIPDNVPFEDAVLTDTIATALRGITQSALLVGDNVVISGAGPIGLAATQLLKIAGARHVTVLEIVAQKRSLAAQLGADMILDPVAEGEGLKDRIAACLAALAPIWPWSAPARRSPWRHVSIWSATVVRFSTSAPAGSRYLSSRPSSLSGRST